MLEEDKTSAVGGILVKCQALHRTVNGGGKARSRCHGLLVGCWWARSTGRSVTTLGLHAFVPAVLEEFGPRSTQERMEALNVAGVVRAQQQAAGAWLRARAHHIGSRGVLLESALWHQR